MTFSLPLPGPSRPAIPRPRSQDRDPLDPDGRAQRPVSALLHSSCGGRQEVGDHRRVPRAGGGRTAVGGSRAIDTRSRRRADGALRAECPGSRRSPQPNPRPGRITVTLRPCLHGPWASCHPPGVGRNRATPVGPIVHPQEGPVRHRPDAPASVPDQAGTGRRDARVGQEVAGATGQTALGIGRRGRTQRPPS